LAQNPDIVIKAADKNLGLTIVDKTWYVDECLKHLQDDDTYQLVSGDVPVQQLTKRLERFVKLAFCYLTPQMRKFVLANTESYRIPCFYLLIKLHKPVISGRPICSSVNWVLHNLSKVADYWLQPYLKRCRSYLKNSTQVINELATVQVPAGTLLVTMDVISLYPSIPIEDGVARVCNFLSTNPLFEDLRREGAPVALIKEALLLILKHNYVEFNDCFFLQTGGTAMGTPAAVTFASLFMESLEDSFFASAVLMPLYYKRFIDDILFLWQHSLADLLIFIQGLQSMHPKIKFEVVIDSTSVDFLDLCIFKSQQLFHTVNGGLLSTKLFQKPMNKYLYLPYSSFHSTACKRGFITGLLKTFIRCCSFKEDFYIFRRLLWFRLRARGYTRSFLRPLFDSLQYSPIFRASLLVSLPVAASLLTKPALPIPVIIPHSPGLPWVYLKHFLATIQRRLATSCPDIFSGLYLFVSLSRTRNLMDMLVKSRFASHKRKALPLSPSSSSSPPTATPSRRCRRKQDFGGGIKRKALLDNSVGAALKRLRSVDAASSSIFAP
jgi:hypothetical protein